MLMGVCSNYRYLYTSMYVGYISAYACVLWNKINVSHGNVDSSACHLQLSTLILQHCIATLSAAIVLVITTTRQKQRVQQSCWWQQRQCWQLQQLATLTVTMTRYNKKQGVVMTTATITTAVTGISVCEYKWICVT